MRRFIYPLLLALTLFVSDDAFSQRSTFFFSTVSQQTSSFDADYQAVLDRGTTLGYTLPSAGQQILQNQLVLDLKSAGIWAKLDVLYVFMTDGDSDFATLNWKDPTQFQCAKVNSPTFTTNEGFQGNGTTSSLNTGYEPAAEATNFTQNSASFGCWINTDSGGADGLGGTGTTMYMRSSNTAAQRINSGASLPSAVNMANAGYKALNRGSSSSIELYNVQTQSTRTVASFAPGSGNLMFCLAPTQSFGSDELAMGYAGGSLTQTEHNNFSTSFNTYRTSL